MATTTRISTATGRQRLAVRREPYWHKLATRQHLGYRKSADGGSWIARLTTTEGKYRYQALGACDDAAGEDVFDTASEAARNWFTSLKGTDTPAGRYTLRLCIDDYIAHLKVEKTERTATDTEQRLTKHTADKLLDVEVAKLTTRQLKSWRDDMVKSNDDPDKKRRSMDSANRVLNMLKAALNLAFKSGMVPDDTAWRRLESFRDVAQARILFLTDKQVTRLLNKSTGALHSLIKAGILTGARYGELVSARVSDFDSAEGTLELSGKTGQRTAYLGSSAVAFVKQQASSKLPAAYLFPRDDGTPWGKSELQRPFRAAVTKAKLPAETVFYSLRHYHISKALLAGVHMQVIAENCGTSVRMIEMHYGKFAKADRRAMMDSVSLAM